MKKTINDYMHLPYREVIEPSTDGGYVGYIPDLKGCMTQGETKEEVLELLDDAKHAWLEAALEDGYPIPQPAADEDFSGRFNLRIPKSLHRKLAMMAKDNGVSLNQMVLYLLASSAKGA